MLGEDWWTRKERDRQKSASREALATEPLRERCSSFGRDCWVVKYRTLRGNKLRRLAKHGYLRELRGLGLFAPMDLGRCDAMRCDRHSS